MPQEFLASFAVDIDEGGVNRLQSILSQNRELADGLASAFDAARASVQAFIREVSEMPRPGASNEASGPSGYVTPLPYRAEGVKGQVQDLFSGLIAPEGDASWLSSLMRSEEISYAGMVSRDSTHFLRQNLADRPTRADFGIPDDYAFSWDSEELSNKVKDIMMEPVEKARGVMKEALDAETAGEDTAVYVERIREIIEKPMQEVRELYESLDLGVYGASNETNIFDALQAQLDFTEAQKSLEAFRKEAEKPIGLTANASGIVSAASSALGQVQSMLAGANLTLKVKPQVEGRPGSSGDSGSPGGFSAVPVLMLSAGGRFSSPTQAEIAEDGDPEYVVPVKKEQEAVPLVRSLLSELSASARESLRDVLPSAPENRPGHGEGSSSSAPVTRAYEPLIASAPAVSDPAPLSGLADLLSSLPEMLSAAPAAAASVVVSSAPPGNISAPVNIHVEAAAADPEAVGRSIYDTAERYLLRTLQGVF